MISDLILLASVSDLQTITKSSAYLTIGFVFVVPFLVGFSLP